MREVRGLPVAGYLALLVALALASAFVAVLAIVIWLPPRPPDVMRADVVADHFEAGYEHMVETGRPLNEAEMVWSIRDEPPEKSASPPMHLTQLALAQQLELRPEQVRVAAENIARNDVFVFRVREVEAMAEEARRAAREAVLEHAEALRQAREAAREARMHADEAEADRADREADRIEREAEAAAREAEREAERDAERDVEHRVHVESGRVVVTAPETPGMAVPETPAPPEPPRFEFVLPTPPTPPTAADAPEPAEPPAPPIFSPAPAGVLLISQFEIGAQLPDGRWLVMRQGRNWAEIGWIGRAALVIGGTLAVLSVLALLFARRLTRPIRNFSEAVQAVGVNPQSEPVREEGPRELRGAARAVNSMQARLRALIADRTKTLAAVAHDMRTPLMRLRLAAENAPPEQRERMAKEIGEVEALVASFIAFARDDPAEEARVRLDLAALLQSIADDHAEHGRNVTFEGQERLIVTGQSLGLKRLFSNLVDNALKYGGAARIRLTPEETAVVVDVEDDGPGVPPEQRESVFEPFVRLNEGGARGAGLGLAAARSIARAHGGDIVILDAAKGARVRVTLPN